MKTFFREYTEKVWGIPCNEIGADMLVMGAYGENRLHAIFGLGRATQKVVSAARIPVFTQR